MTNNKQQTAVEWYHQQVVDRQNGNGDSRSIDEILEEAKEMEEEQMIKLIQFVVSEKELVDYSSVSNETANYYLDKFNQGGNK
jgi:hypothetical protein